MLTKKEKLLIYPYQLKRYYQHRRNVESAGPVIDFYPPSEYSHITTKLKKLQKESERQEKVNKDNVRLLQRLGSIMTTKRLKNFWEHPRPSFLNREVIPHLSFRSNAVTDIPLSPTRKESMPDMSEDADASEARKSRCAICSGKFRITNKVNPEPEERIPWRPQTPTKNMRLIREADMKVHKCCKFCC
jgi:Hemingway/CFA97